MQNQTCTLSFNIRIVIDEEICSLCRNRNMLKWTPNVSSNFSCLSACAFFTHTCLSSFHVRWVKIHGMKLFLLTSSLANHFLMRQNQTPTWPLQVLQVIFNWTIWIQEVEIRFQIKITSNGLHHVNKSFLKNSSKYTSEIHWIFF